MRSRNGSGRLCTGLRSARAKGWHDLALSSKEDAWRLLARFLTSQDLERFRRPRRGPGDLRSRPGTSQLNNAGRRHQGRARPHSRFLREGVADTLALMATRPVSNWPGGSGTGQSYVNAIVMQLLRQANDDQSGKVGSPSLMSCLSG